MVLWSQSSKLNSVQPTQLIGSNWQPPKCNWIIAVVMAQLKPSVDRFRLTHPSPTKKGIWNVAAAKASPIYPNCFVSRLSSFIKTAFLNGHVHGHVFLLTHAVSLASWIFLFVLNNASAHDNLPFLHFIMRWRSE